MAVTTKAKPTTNELEEALNNNLNNVFKPTQNLQPLEPIANNSNSKTKTQSKKVLLNFKINETLLQELRNYCESNYMTLTAGITKAINEMLKKEGK